jgi:hypothetical protein
MESEHRIARETNALARNEREDEGTGRQAFSVDHDVLAGIANGCVSLHIAPERPAGVVADEHRRVRRGHARCEYSAADGEGPAKAFHG